MRDLQSIHCRLCKQTYMITSETIAAQKCDLCGQTGGFIDPNIAEEADRERFIERAREQARKNKAWNPAKKVVRLVSPILVYLYCGCYLWVLFTDVFSRGSTSPIILFWLAISPFLLLAGTLLYYWCREESQLTDSPTDVADPLPTPSDRITRIDNITKREDQLFS